MEDFEILRRAHERENDSRDRRPKEVRSWEYFTVGASQRDIKRLLDEELVTISFRSGGVTRYRLTKKANDLVWGMSMEKKFTRIPADSILEAMELLIGFDDVKQAIALAIESQRKINFLLEGPPACGKSILLEAVRSAVPEAFIAFGSRTSASGLSDALFERQPSILLLDECDKMHNDCYSVMLGLMESGEILETKSMKTRGIRLKTTVIAACNSSAKMPREFLSRFALHVLFPHFTRDEFVEVCRGFLTRGENCPGDLAELIGTTVYDSNLGDIRKARGVWQLMTAPTKEEVWRVIQLMQRYSPNNNGRRQRQAQAERMI